MTARAFDAVVVGAGPNGLVAANHLADAGWTVVVLESEPEVGGAVKSSRDLHPDFVHDTFSAFYPLAAASPTLQSFGLENHGLSWTHAPAVLGHQTREGTWALVHRDPDVTAALMDDAHPGDGQAWLALCAQWAAVNEPLLGALLSPFPPLRHGPGLIAGLRLAGGMPFVKTMLNAASEVGASRFGGQAPRLILAGNAAHADIPVNTSGSALMGILLSMLAQTVGFPAPAGGAGNLAHALRRRFEALGGEIRCCCEVVGIRVDNRRATAVRLRDGELIAARRAVIADVAAPHLYGHLVDEADLPARTLSAMRTFTMDPATLKVDWALDGAVPWAQPPPIEPGTVHIADSVNEMITTQGQVAAGLLPAAPFILAGQMSTTDPRRSPAGTQALWAYSHVPHAPRGDATDEWIVGDWGHDDCERFADRMQARIELLAPGFTTKVLARRILGPREFEARDANLIGGSINGGTAQLHQQLIFRPMPGLARAETPVRGLFLGSASAHPGGGVHGAPGMNAARAAIAHDALRRASSWLRPTIPKPRRSSAAPHVN